MNKYVRGNLIDSLANHLNVHVYELPWKLEDPAYRTQAEEYLQAHLLYLTYKNRPALKMESLSFEDATKLPAYNGKKNVTVDMHYFSKYKFDLRHPLLPCIVEQRGRGSSYYPMELIDAVPRVKQRALPPSTRLDILCDKFNGL